MSSPPPTYPPAELKVEKISKPSVTVAWGPASPGKALRGASVSPLSQSEEDTTGPIQYPGNALLCLFCYTCLVVLFLLKLLIFLWYTVANYGQGASVEPIWFSAYMLGLLNFWIRYQFKWRSDYKTLPRLNNGRFLLNPAFYLFILDNLIYLGMPLLGLYLDIPGPTGPVYVGLVLAFLNILNYYIFIAYETSSHFPLLLDYKFVLGKADSKVEEKSPLKLVESSAFLIQIEVLGQIPADKEFAVTREFWRTSYDGKKYVFSPPCSFSFKVKEKLAAGAELMLIPETHERERAIKIEGYRSFGDNKEQELITSVFKKSKLGKKSLCTKLTQFYTDIDPKNDTLTKQLDDLFQRLNKK